VAPPRCFEPPALQNRGRVWGWSVQLYGVRSARNWGMGDFGDLMRLVELAAALGAGVIGVNPLHALFPARPAQISPYSPSHRAFINPLYLDIEGLDDCNESAAARQRIANPHFDARLQELRARELVDHVGVAAAKWPMLELCYEHFRTQHLDRNSPRAQAFRQYQEERGQTLHRYALHDALHEHFLGRDAHLWGWPVWPESYRTPDAQAVEEFAVKHADRIQFFEYAQWQCELQLERVAARARELNLAIGLYFDVAIGVDRGGAETWSEQSAYALHASAGAPPDEYNVNGQDWGLPPLIPERLRGAAYRPFVATLDASMRHAGAVRLDHVMALQRLYWVPSLHKASAGAYVEYPLRDLLALLALESRRRRCLVVGEDLGTVAPEVRRALHDAGVLSYRPLYFEKNEDGSFTRPSGYPARALCSLGTHDLPTLRGYWSANDVEWRRKLGLYPSEEVELAQFAARARDRIEFARALQREGLLPASDAPLDWSPQVTLAAYEFLARTPCKVLLVQPEDVFGELEQANLPGTVDEHPNWRRKLPLPLEQWERHAALLELAARLRAARPG
jgi:(1->4)-alpha-D-glucan 1-alpha-D-glucosylmutase